MVESYFYAREKYKDKTLYWLNQGMIKKKFKSDFRIQEKVNHVNKIKGADLDSSCSSIYPMLSLPL